jgi:predicted MFS family arabinose efflux permease
VTTPESTATVADHSTFRRDPLTLLCYGLLAYMGYLFVSPAVFLPRLKEELHLGYGVTAAHIAVSAGGSMLMSALLPRLERTFRRRTLIWSGVAVSACGELLLASAHHVAATIAAMAVIGVASTPIVGLTQAVLADIHGESRAVALSEANTVAATGGVLAPLLIGGAASLLPAIGWRGGLVFGAAVGLLLPVAYRRWTFPDGGTLGEMRAARLPAAVRVRGGLLFTSVIAEICTTFLGPTYLRDAIHFSQGMTAALSGLFLCAIVAGRAIGSVFARRLPPPRLLAVALLVTSVGFVVLWSTTGRLMAASGYAIVGLGVANLFPLNVSLVIAAAPDRSGQAVSACILISSSAGLFGPLALGALADATTIRTAFVIVPIALGASTLLLATVSRPRHEKRASKS